MNRITLDYSKLKGRIVEKCGSQKAFAELLGFDSVTHYQYMHFAGGDAPYPEIMKNVLREWERIHEEYSIPYYPHVTIGWDNNPRHKFLTRPIITDNGPENIKKAFESAKEYSDKYNTVPLITVNSWNEWTEMSYLEPDDVYGYGYLEAVRDVFMKEE